MSKLQGAMFVMGLGIILGCTGVLSGSAAVGVIALVLVVGAFAVIFAEQRRAQRDMQTVQKLNGEFVEFILGKRNDVNMEHYPIEASCMGVIKEEIEKTLGAFKQRETDNLGIYGDIMITCEKVSDGYLDERITFETKNPQLKYIAKTLNDMFGKVDGIITNVLNVFESYSRKDFENHLQDYKQKGGIGTLIEGVNDLGDQLGVVRKNNMHYAAELTKQADELKTIVNNLQNSSNEQASSLEETAAAATQISSSIAGVSEKISGMNRSVEVIEQALRQGRSEAVDTREYIAEVTHAAAQIADATKNLEEIAVQTNILSLNASVEAASAGEHGRGFSIVAQEVGALASKSSEVVQNVKTIVERSLASSKKGEERLESMVATIERINGKIGDSKSASQEVSHITTEQNNGIEQINEALYMLERLSNKNLDLSQETYEVSDRVSDLALTLKKSI